MNSRILKKNMIPNYLTVLRMVLAIIVICFLIFPFGPVLYTLKNPTNCDFRVSFFLAGIFFVIASFSDYLDGYLARKYKWVSDFGKFWDPVADKVLVNCTLICLSYQGLIPIWITVILIGRDIVVDGVRMVSSLKGRVISAGMYGKLKTVSQMIGIIFIFFIFNQDIHSLVSDTDKIYYWCVQNLMMYFSLCFSLISGGIYLFKKNG